MKLNYITQNRNVNDMKQNLYLLDFCIYISDNNTDLYFVLHHTATIPLNNNSYFFCAVPSILLNAYHYPDSKAHGANMGPTWALSATDGPKVEPCYQDIVFILPLCTPADGGSVASPECRIKSNRMA